jgi:purine nucleoside permease
VLQALTFVSRTGRVDSKRVLVLRTASDFDQPRPGLTASEGLKQSNTGGYTGLTPALESAWRVGNAVVSELVSKWSRYRDEIPQGAR